MSVSLLAPLFLAGLVALVVPVLVHLTNRDRKDVVRFPSLKFLTKLPYRQMRRQRIQHWLLFAMRALAIALLALAFARPLIEGALVGTASSEPGREVVLVVDRSCSMAYGDTWDRALDAAREAVSRQPPNSRLSLVTFDDRATLVLPPTTDPLAVRAALDTLTPGAGTTRFAAALQLANQVVLESPLADREVVVVSDWQAIGWDRLSGTSLLPGTTLTPVTLSPTDVRNALITSVEVQRSDAGGRRSVMVTARVVNQGDASVETPVTLAVNGDEVATETAVIPARESRLVRLGPVAQPSSASRVTVRLGDDLLAPDNIFHLALSSRSPLTVLLVEASGVAEAASLYFREALANAKDPEVTLVRRSVQRLRPADVDGATVVVLHDSPFPSGAAGAALVRHVAEGGGLWIVLGGRSQLGSWSETAQPIMPGRWRRAVDRLDRSGARLASVDYDHPAFQVFSGPDDGNVAGPRFYRYRPILPADSAIVLARYTDGAVAFAGVGHGRGRVLLWGSPFDNRWSNLPIQPVFLPFVHQVIQFLGGERAADGWRLSGQVVDLRDVLLEMGLDADTLSQDVIVESPTGRRRDVDVAAAEQFFPVSEAGFYEVYPLGRERSSYPLAVNVDHRESNLDPLDVAGFVAASTAPDTAGLAEAARAGALTPEERERRQGGWWFLLLGAFVLLVAESLWSNRLLPDRGPSWSAAAGAESRGM